MLLVTLPDFHERIEQLTWVCLKIRPPKPMVHHHVPSLSIYIYNVCVRSFLGGKISFSETSHYIPMWLAINSIRPNFPCMILIYSDKPNQRWRNNMVVTISRAFFLHSTQCSTGPNICRSEILDPPRPHAEKIRPRSAALRPPTVAFLWLG
jgi:hypothetical protein